MDDNDRTFIKEIDGKSFRSVVMKLTKELNGTVENPVRIRIKQIDDEQEKVFDTWCETRNGKSLLKFKEIKEVKVDPEIENKPENIEEVQPKE
jgi:C-terminal processing protease CtpA/Prc